MESRIFAICPAGERLVYHYTNVEKGLTLRRYWTNVCQGCAIKLNCTTGKERRITRWERAEFYAAQGEATVRAVFPPPGPLLAA